MSKPLRQFTVTLNEDYAVYVFQMIESGRAEGFADAFRILIDKDRGVVNPDGYRLTTTQWAFIRACGKEGKHIRDIQAVGMWSHGMVSNLAHRLEKRGIIERTQPGVYRLSPRVAIEL